MSLDPRTPVIVGTGQLNDRALGSEPIDLMARSTEAALADSGVSALRDAIDAVRVVWGVWPYRDPGRLVAERIGADGARSTITTLGGNMVYDVVIDTANRIATGDLDVAVVCAAENLRTRRADHARGEKSPYLAERDGAEPDDVMGSDQPMNTEVERAIGIERVIARFYAMAETALRHRLGESIDAHRRRIATLWSRASEVAAANPDAWSRQPLTAEQIATESPGNRPVASPYPKMMTSNLDVDQGGAVVMCSVEAAERAGVARDRWVFPWSGAAATDAWYPTNRWAFDESPAMRASGRTALDMAGLSVDECGLLDLYSCFPVAVQVAQREIGVPADRDFTITGGLTFAAGPLNCYCILPLTRAVGLLREQPTTRAFLTGNGGSFTKHSAIVLAAEPPADGFRSAIPQAAVDGQPTRTTPSSAAERGTVETYTVTFDRERRPERAILAVLDESGSRHWAESADPDTMDALLNADRCDDRIVLDGTTAHLC